MILYVNMKKTKRLISIFLKLMTVVHVNQTAFLFPNILFMQ